MKTLKKYDNFLNEDLDDNMRDAEFEETPEHEESATP